MRIRKGARGGHLVLFFALVTGALALQGCRAEEPVYEHMIPPPGHGPYTGTVADWPLWFPWHQFGVYCFSVQGCNARYAGIPFGTGQPRPSFESLGRPLESVLRAGNGPIRNFPPPAEVTWTSQDGTPLTASVDIAEIFADRMVRHTVAREDILENSYIPYPGIILVVDDRTISTYMSTWLPLKKSPSQDSESREGRVHTEVVLVHSTTY